MHGRKGAVPRPVRLNGIEVETIGSSLEAGAEVADPVALIANQDHAFVGSYVLGMGFVLGPEEAAPFYASAHEAVIVRPFIGGEEVNTNAPGSDGMAVVDRFVISFFDRSLEQAGAWPALLAIVEERVKPERTRLNAAGEFQLRSPLPQRWWQFADKRPALYAKLKTLRRCLACSQVSKHHLFGWQPTDRVFAHTLNVFAYEDDASFAVLQSRVHEAWARHAGLTSTMKTDTRYTPSTCFETFPFPRPTEPQRVACAAAGEALDAQRTVCMRKFSEGMTRVWNRLVDPDHPDHHDPDIDRLRALRDAMDRAVLTAYGWSDLDPADTAAIVKRLRLLNTERAAEEARGA